MQCQRIVGVIGLCLCLSGCQLASDITHNLYFETCLFANDVKAKVYYPFLAHSAWHSYAASHPECAASTDFACGFKAGYADYLEYGGDGHSSRLPPLRYWKLRRETPEGREATKQWLAGFREGAAAAHASGYRQLIVVPVDSGGPTPPSTPPLPTPPLPAPSLPVPQLPAGPASDELPNPRSLPSPAPTGRSRALSAPLVPPLPAPLPTPQQPASPSSRLPALRLDDLSDSRSLPSAAPAQGSGSASAVPTPAEHVPAGQPTVVVPPIPQLPPAAFETSLHSQGAPERPGMEQTSAAGRPAPDALASRPLLQPVPPPPPPAVPQESLPVIRTAPPPQAAVTPERLPIIRTAPSPQVVVPPAPIQPTALLVEQSKPEETTTEQSVLPRIVTSHEAAEAAPSVDWSRVPRNAEMLSQIGLVALRAGSTEAGIRWLEAALQVDPHYAPAHKALMEYYEKKGDFFRAAEHRAQAETPQESADQTLNEEHPSPETTEPEIRSGGRQPPESESQETDAPGSESFDR